MNLITCFEQQLTSEHRNHSWNPLPLLKGGRTFRKMSHLGGGGGVRNFLLERGINLITLQFNHIYCMCGESKVSFITFWIFSLWSYPFKSLIQVFIVLKPGIICTFLIHSGSVQKKLAALFNLVWNTQKS